MTNNNSDNLISFQGDLGAYSNLAAKQMFPDMEVLPCRIFEDALAAVDDGKAKYAAIPIENSVAGRVADIHYLIPHSNLHIIKEHFLRINHNLLVIPGTKVEDLKSVRSHEQALGQCRRTMDALGIKREVYADTAAAAKHVAELGDPTVGAIASSLAGEIYGLESIKKDIEDAEHNTTRFVVFSREPLTNLPQDQPTMTSFIFQVRNTPAALYKVMGGFATNGINMTKLESYQLDGEICATQFYADIEGHPDDEGVKHAFEELSFYTDEYRILGSYPQSQYRIDQRG
ncbi:prephenate dehydratase [Pseudemcibacter aquimaris]|uniref:prephenate dehydratase n=1 Tax=Pseudemcibacter aquimaris TaxID=2857064 RepID=UPI002010E220|nr:prephenate dehydratase [Pseudemcibacter aquimaris]MCC3862064.1 prephenate dehydratase [Pseudemcibacter aquimaris]WDU58816.1 prephenate dehydratase [Pseudemcibacter aquimaris]